MAIMALEDDDTAAAAEELLFAASHAARAVLLKSGVFPLSSPSFPRSWKASTASCPAPYPAS